MLYERFNNKEFSGELPPYCIVFKEQKAENGKVPDGMLHPRERMRFSPESGRFGLPRSSKVKTMGIPSRMSI
jgi:hypothetical protein